MNRRFVQCRIRQITDVTAAVSCNKYGNFIRFMLPVALPAALPGAAMGEVTFAFAGLGKEGFIHFDNAGKGIRVGVGTGV